MAPFALPLDVVDYVCSFVSAVQLVAVASSCSLLHPVALRRIYRELELATPEQAVRCLSTLDKHPHLARYVRVLSLRLDSRKPVDDPYASFRTLLKDALSRMDGLVELDLVLAPADGSVIFKGLDPVEPSYPRLSRLSTNLSLDDAMCSFLERTPALRDLQLGEETPSLLQGPPLRPLSAAALPNLSLFMGSMASVSMIAPGRPLESVHLYSATPSTSSSPSEEEELSPEVLSALAQATGPITVFGALTRSLSLDTVRGLAESLPHLHHLRIMTMYHAQTAHHPDEAFYTQVVRALSTLPHLLTAELAGFRWAPCKKTESNRSAQPARVPDAAAGNADADIAGTLDDTDDNNETGSDVHPDDFDGDMLYFS